MSTKKWSQQVCETVLPVLDKINAHPFIVELMNGTLDTQKFSFYIQQDTLYLGVYGKILSGIAERLDNPEYKKAFVFFAEDSMYVEKSMQEVYKEAFEMKEADKKSPSCTLYTSFLESCFYTKPVEVSLSSVLPCFWIYLKVGEYLVANQKKGQNPYQDWIDTYSGDEFAKSVDNVLAIADDLASKCDEKVVNQMTEAFILASNMEYMFWDSAYKQEKWIL